MYIFIYYFYVLPLYLFSTCIYLCMYRYIRYCVCWMFKWFAFLIGLWSLKGLRLDARSAQIQFALFRSMAHDWHMITSLILSCLHLWVPSWAPLATAIRRRSAQNRHLAASDFPASCNTWPWLMLMTTKSRTSWQRSHQAPHEST